MKYTIRLKDNKNFVSIFKRGKFIADKCCVFYYRKNGKNSNRLGITTGKKVGCAVKRSRCRRIIRQAYAENEASFPMGYDFIMVARPFTCECKTYRISSFLKKRVIPELNKVTASGYKPKSSTESKK